MSATNEPPHSAAASSSPAVLEQPSHEEALSPAVSIPTGFRWGAVAPAPQKLGAPPAPPSLGPLAAFVRVNPVSHLVSATRALANHAMISSEVGWTLLAGLAVIAIFAPLSVASYKRHI